MEVPYLGTELKRNKTAPNALEVVSSIYAIQSSQFLFHRSCCSFVSEEIRFVTGSIQLLQFCPQPLAVPVFPL